MSDNNVYNIRLKLNISSISIKSNYYKHECKIQDIYLNK